jgi:hypothetical protein
MAILILLCGLSFNALAFNVPSFIPYQGHLTDAAGIDLTADVPLEVRLYDSLIAGVGQGVDNSHVIYAEKHASVHVEKGIFRLNIGKGASLNAKWTALPIDNLVAKENVYLELWVDGERLSPRQRMGSVPAVVQTQYVKYADTLTHIPKIEPSMMPSYDAGKITTGQFAQNQVPNLATGKFTSGALSPSTIPLLDASQFNTGPTQPKISVDCLPHDMSATKIQGAPLSLDRLPQALLLSANVAIGAGTKGQHEMIILPDGYAPNECKVALSLASIPGTAENGLQYLNISLDSNNVLNCTYYGSEHPEQTCSANYFYICKKSGQ